MVGPALSNREGPGSVASPAPHAAKTGSEGGSRGGSGGGGGGGGGGRSWGGGLSRSAEALRAALMEDSRGGGPWAKRKGAI